MEQKHICRNCIIQKNLFWENKGQIILLVKAMLWPIESISKPSTLTKWPSRFFSVHRRGIFSKFEQGFWQLLQDSQRPDDLEYTTRDLQSSGLEQMLIFKVLIKSQQHRQNSSLNSVGSRSVDFAYCQWRPNETKLVYFWLGLRVRNNLAY